MIKGGAITNMQIAILFGFQILLVVFIYFIYSCGGLKYTGLKCISNLLKEYLDSDSDSDSEEEAAEEAAEEKAAEEKAAEEKAAEEKAAEEKAAEEEAAEEKAAQEAVIKAAIKAAEEAARIPRASISALDEARAKLDKYKDNSTVMNLLDGVSSAIPSVDDLF